MSKNNGSIRKRQSNGKLPDGAVIAGKNDMALTSEQNTEDSGSWLRLLICVGGIYASFLTWGILQERITTTNYGTDAKREVFKYSIFMNTVQSIFAAIFGYVFILMTRKSSTDLPIIPKVEMLWPLGMVTLTSAFASPFGYASLQYVDYITFILAKSCKLLPVMFLHVTLYGKRYPFYKYAVVGLVTAGVAIFTLQQPAGKKKKGADGNSSFGLLLLGINLLFDGLTNAAQDSIYAKFRPYSGQQMMCALNIMSSLLTSTYLLVLPYLAQSGIGSLIGLDLGTGVGELYGALDFIQRHPEVGWDILGFAASGALGQVFIFMTLSIFGSLLLVTVTVTRKIFTMVLSVFWFGHKLTPGQLVGVGLVFGGIGIEAQLTRREKAQKELAKELAKKGK